MSDLIVKLYDREFPESPLAAGIVIKKALILDKDAILDFVRENFNEGWVKECEYALFQQPSKIWLAVKDKQIIGFACYDATAKDFFGPTGVKKELRGQGIGQSLLVKSLQSMKELGYAYAIIGWTNEAKGFYKKVVSAVEIPDSGPNKSIYRNLVGIDEK